jgi:hypothetical protein
MPQYAREPRRETQTPEQPKDTRSHVFLQNGTLFIEVQSLAEHVNALGRLKGVSHATADKFDRIDTLSREEKKLLAKMQATLQSIHDGIEHADTLLFTGD